MTARLPLNHGFGFNIRGLVKATMRRGGMMRRGMMRRNMMRRGLVKAKTRFHTCIVLRTQLLLHTRLLVHNRFVMKLSFL